MIKEKYPSFTQAQSQLSLSLSLSNHVHSNHLQVAIAT